MTIQNYRVYYSTGGAFIGYLDNVQNIQINVGKQKQLDQIKTSTATITLRYPNGFKTPIPELITGSFIMVQNITNDLWSNYQVWAGRITDVVATYGLPYANDVGPADYLTISCEGNFGALGRMQGENYSMAAGSVRTQLSTLSTQTGVTVDYLPTVGGNSTAATTVSGTWGDYVGRVCQTTNSRLWDGANSINTAPGSTVVSPFVNFQSNGFFSDTNIGVAGVQTYSQINFDSYADNYYTQVTVTPESFGSATVTAVGATKPYRTYQTNTLNTSTAQANDYANYLLNNFSSPQLGISSVTCIGEAQPNFRLDRIGYNNAFANCPGAFTSVFFRGNVYSCVIEGATMSATPAGSTFTFFLSDADLNSYLILDSFEVGRLNQNRLGY